MSSLGTSTVRKLGPPVTVTETFYAASSSGGTVNVLNTVTVINGEVTQWTQATAGAGAGTGEPLGLLLALTQA